MIDNKDKLILFELFQNSRQSNIKIAKILGIPEKTVTNRINELIKRKIIKKFTIIVNYQNLGKNRHSIYFDLSTVEQNEINQKVKQISKIPEVSCCYYLHEVSEWKLYVSVWTNTIREYDDIQTKVLSLLGDSVKNYVSFQSVKSYTYLSRLLNLNKIAKCDVKEDYQNIQLNDIEEKLIKILHKNSRRPLLEIAHELNVHTDTVKRKIKKLIDLDILQRFYPLIDLHQIGIREYTFIARLNPSESNQVEEFIKWARGNPHFVIIIKAVGWVNLYYAFQVENNQQFKDIRSEIQKRLGKITLKEYRIEVEEFVK